MYLKRLEIYGFKSFADKIELEFEDGITAVVGPNGSGKSNISDAVRWVLGEQSAKSLRGSKMEDIIFAGTQKRKPLGYAEVSLIIDNHLGKLPIDYTEVRITRRVFRSGESEFYINKSSCRLKDIHQLFMDTGLGKEGYSIIGQGKIDEILSASSQDRRYIFEEAAGIVKYKSRKNEAEKKLERTDQNLIRIVDIIKELESQIEPLSIQAEKAKQYLQISGDLKEHELALFIHKIDSLKEKENNIKINKIDLLSQIKEREEEIEGKEKTYNECKKELKEIEDEVQKSQKYLYEIRSEIEKVQSEIQIADGKIQNIHENKKRISIEIHDTKERIVQYEQQKNDMEIELEECVTKIHERSSVLLKEKENLDYLRKILREKETRMEEKRQEKFELINRLSDLKSNLNGVHIMKNNIEKQVIQMGRQLNDLRQKQKKEKIKLNEEQQKKEMKEKEISSTKNSKDILENQLNELITQLIKLKDESQSILKEIQLKQSRVRVLIDMEKEYEGYFRSVKNLMREREKNQSLQENIYGVVAELINVPQQYISAIETALGSALQNIITKDEFVAQKCIEILKHKKWGRATFLPLETIKGIKIQKELSSLKDHRGFIGIASELIEYNPIFTPIMNQLLGRVIIVKEIEDAIYLSRKLNHRYKIVTLEAEVFNPGGSIVGGSKSQYNSGILSRSKEIQVLKEELKDLTSRHADLNKNIEDIEENKKDVENQEKKLVESIQAKEMQIIAIDSLCQQIKSNEERIDIELGQIQDELKTFEIESNELKEKEKELEKKIGEMNDGIGKVNNEISENQDISQEDKDKLEVLNDYITQLEIDSAKSQQQKIDVQNQLGQIKESIINHKKDLHQKNTSLRDYEVQIDENHLKIKELEEKINQLSNRNLERDLQLKNLLQQKKDMEEREEGFEEQLREYNKQLAVSNNALHKIEIQLNKIEMEMDNLQNKIYEDYQLTYNLALGYKKEIENLSKIFSEIQNYKEQIRKLGNVNLDAIEEYDRISERFMFLTKQREDLHAAKESLNQVINEITITMEKQFSEQFEVIKDKFNEVFQELFKGGYANVYLTDSQHALTSGVEIEVQPPGKKTQNLSLLSGGERALTAIALLFAILKVKPTPFCILDEIEAALDDANVYRYASFLKEFSKETQFIAVTHRKGTMESADVLYGVTMEEQGISKLVSVKLTELAS